MSADWLVDLLHWTWQHNGIDPRFYAGFLASTSGAANELEFYSDRIGCNVVYRNGVPYVDLEFGTKTVSIGPLSIGPPND